MSRIPTTLAVIKSPVIINTKINVVIVAIILNVIVFKILLLCVSKKVTKKVNVIAI